MTDADKIDVLYFSLALLAAIVGFFFWEELKANPYYLGQWRGFVWPAVFISILKALNHDA